MENFVSSFIHQRPQQDSTDGFCIMFADLLRKIPEEKRATVQLKIWQYLEAIVSRFQNSASPEK